jgi:hypothetical protein
LPEDVVRWKVNHTHNERLRVWKQRRQMWVATQMVARAWGRIPHPNLNPRMRRKKRRGEITPPL